jgi:uncharacterized phage protein gp47/JayE
VYEDQTYDAIMARLLAAIPDTLDKREGSFIWDALSPAALELAQVYIQMDLMLQYGFAQTTYGQYLDYRAGEHGITRKVATQASGQVTISGSNGTVIAAGSLFATGAGVQFETLAEVTIGEAGSIEADIRSVEAGARGNVPTGSITEIPVSIAGVTAVTNANPTTGGTDQETDAALLERLLEKVRTPATSGNVAHYLQWAKSVSGVGDAIVFPIWDGNGTVKVVVIDANKEPASAEIVSDVEDYIAEVRPIGATVTVVAATALDIDVVATLSLATGAIVADVKTAFEAALVSYLQQIAFKQSYVSYAQVGSLLLDTPGILDYSNLTLNTGTGNVAIGDAQVAVKGTVTLNE